MGAPEAVVWGLISGLTSMGFALAGLRSRRRARLVADTPTSPATRGEPGDRVEIRGRVVAEGATIEAPLSGRQAVWVHVQVSEEQGSSRTTLVESVRAVPFLVDDGSGRTARVEPRASSDGVAEFDATIGGSWDAAHEGRRERVEALLKKSGKTGYDPKRLTWSERALCVGDPVYVLGPAEVRQGPPQLAGYRSTSATQLVLRGTPESPLLVAAMTEARLLATLRGRASTYTGLALFVAVLGVVATFIASFTECQGSSD